MLREKETATIDGVDPQAWLIDTLTCVYVCVGSNPVIRRVRYGRPVCTCEQALPLATPVI